LVSGRAAGCLAFFVSVDEGFSGGAGRVVSGGWLVGSGWKGIFKIAGFVEAVLVDIFFERFV
jgi:hypothetical protein